MTAEQRAELLKHVSKHDLTEKISYKDCEKIAKDLNLTLEQVGLFQAVGLILLFICFGIYNVSSLVYLRGNIDLMGFSHVLIKYCYRFLA